MKKGRDYKILNEKPPIAEECERVFKVDWNKGFACGYDGVIYIRSGIHMSIDFIVHELTHLRQQKEIGGSHIWWPKYFTDAKFRMTQEVPAYQAQWRSFCQRMKDKNEQYRFLQFIIKCLELNYGFQNLDKALMARVVKGEVAEYPLENL